jgi:hypothetical protein
MPSLIKQKVASSSAFLSKEPGADLENHFKKENRITRNVSYKNWALKYLFLKYEVEFRYCMYFSLHFTNKL